MYFFFTILIDKWGDDKSEDEKSWHKQNEKKKMLLM